MKQHLGNAIRNNKKVMENYFFMTILQILNMCFYLLIYPFLIRTLGTEGYGLYAYSASLVFLFITFVNFGFDLPAARQVALHVNNKEQLEVILSNVQTAKIYIEIIAIACYSALFFINPIMAASPIVFWLTFLQTLTFILFPQWYYQGLQNMKFVTYIQLGFRLLSLPFIFLLISSSDDVWIFALIASLSSLFGGVTAWLMIRYKDGLHLKWASLEQVKTTYKEAIPFCGSNIVGVVKEQGLILLTGAFLSLTDVAIYDLANKIMLIPRTIFSKLNDALYPKLVVKADRKTNCKVLLYEVGIGLLAILSIVVLGPLAVWILGGEQMMDAYGITILLSFTILSWLVVGALIQFFIIPSGQNRYVLYNQVIAFVSCFSIAGIGLYLWANVYVLAAGYAFSGLCEIIYCYVIVKKNRLL